MKEWMKTPWHNHLQLVQGFFNEPFNGSAYLLGPYHVPDTVQSIDNTGVGRQNSPRLPRTHSLLGRQINNCINKDQFMISAKMGKNRILWEGFYTLGTYSLTKVWVGISQVQSGRELQAEGAACGKSVRQETARGILRTEVLGSLNMVSRPS